MGDFSEQSQFMPSLSPFFFLFFPLGELRQTEQTRVNYAISGRRKSPFLLALAEVEGLTQLYPHIG